MTRFITRILMLAVLAASASASELRIASWNIERLGHGNQKSFPALAQVVGQFDFLAIQESIYGLNASWSGPLRGLKTQDATDRR